MQTHTLETERLILRGFCKNDFEAVHSYASNIDNIKYMIWGPNDEHETKKFIQECIEWETKVPCLHYDFAITLKENGDLIGGCGVYLDEKLTTGMLGWILNKGYWKQGYMPEVGKALLKYGFEGLKLHRIYATCNADNYGSFRVMEKCGMRKEAHFVKNCYGRVGLEKQWYDQYHYGMVEEEWYNISNVEL